EFEAVVSGDIYVLAPKDTRRLLPELLPFLCLSERFFQHAVGTSAGSLSPRTNWSSLASFEFDLPPLDQQRRIAEILWAVDAVLRAHQQTHDSLLEVFLTELRKVYLGRIGHEGIESFRMEALPNGWRMVTVAEIARVIRGSSPRPKSDPRYYGGTIPRVMVADITRDKKHILPSIDFLTEEGSKLSRPVTQGTLVLVCSGTPQQVGLPGILATDACIHDGIIGLVDIAEDCRTEWLFHLFRFSQSFMDSAATHGGTFVNLTTDIVKGIQFGLPSPDVQDACIARFAKLELGLASCEASIESDRKLQQSFLNAIS
ncbi:MAG: restriction endonuclease subunit S, partial [Roseimicrobium sp.]